MVSIAGNALELGSDYVLGFRANWITTNWYSLIYLDSSFASHPALGQVPQVSLAIPL